MKGLLRPIVVVAASTLAAGTVPVWAAQPHPPIILADSHDSQGYLGVSIRDIDNQEAASLKMDEPHGAEIIRVDHDGPAGKAGLRVHDVIVAMNGETIESQAQLRRMLRETPAGRTIRLQVLRDGKQQQITVQLANRAEVEAQAWPVGPVILDNTMPSVSLETPAPPSWFTFDSAPGDGPKNLLLFVGSGLDVEPLGKQLADFFGVSNGGLLVRRVDPNSNAATAGLKAGDIITKANGQPVSTLQGWLMVLSQEQGRAIPLKVVRNHKEQSMSYTPAAHSQGDLELPAYDAEAAEDLARQISLLDTANIDAQIKRAMLQVQQVDLPRIQDEVDRAMERIQPQLDRQMQSLRTLQPRLDEQMRQMQQQLNRPMLNEFD